MSDRKLGFGTLAVHAGQETADPIIGSTQVGDEIVSANNLYGETYELFHYTFPKLGRKVIFVDSTRPEEFKKAITDRTKAILCRNNRKPRAGCARLRCRYNIGLGH